MEANGEFWKVGSARKQMNQDKEMTEEVRQKGAGWGQDTVVKRRPLERQEGKEVKGLC